MSKRLILLILFCMIFLTGSCAQARGQGGHSFRRFNFDRQISEFRRSGEVDFRRNEDDFFRRVAQKVLRESERSFLSDDSSNITRRMAYQHFRLGLNDLFQVNNCAQAILEFTKAIEIYPDLERAYHFRGLTYYKEKRFSEALADAKKGEELGYPDSSSLINLINRAIIHQQIEPFFTSAFNDFRQDSFTSAIAGFTRIIELEPTNKVAYYCRGYSYFRLLEMSKALADFYKADELGMAVNPELINLVKKSASDAELSVPKIVELSQQIKQDSNNAKLYLRRGLWYKRQNNYVLAIADYTKSIQLNSNSPFAYRRRAVCYFFEKDYDNAWADVHKAETFGDTPNVKYLAFISALKKQSGRDK